MGTALLTTQHSHKLLQQIQDLFDVHQVLGLQTLPVSFHVLEQLGMGLTELGATDVRAVDAGDGVNQIVRLVNDHHLALQPDPRGLPGGRVQQRLVGQHHQLGGDGGHLNGGGTPSASRLTPVLVSAQTRCRQKAIASY